MKTQYRFLARIIIEATSPLNIGSGHKGIMSDSLVLRDVNGLPYIPGTTIAGLLRHTITDKRKENENDKDYNKRLEALRAPLMGSQEYGSPLIISEAKMLDGDGTVLDGIVDPKRLKGSFLANYQKLPIRQHARIGHRGGSETRGKFDEEIVLKGTRFCFEMEMLSDKDDDSEFIELINALNSDTFLIGSGSRSGFGEIKIVDGQYKTINLGVAKQKEWYLEKTSSLNGKWVDAGVLPLSKDKSCDWTCYELELHPTDFLHFGSGLSNEKAKMTYVRESLVDWSTTPAQLKNSDRVVLIPASSVKGALSHRLAFHYNLIIGKFADKLADGEKIEDFVGKNNVAVKVIFGSEGEKDADGKMQNKLRGNVLMTDLFIETETYPKILNHVSIDRFTGGSIDGALFSEEVLFVEGLTFKLRLKVDRLAFKDGNVEKAFEKTLEDLCSGMLPLGGGVNRGNGCFTKGKITKNGNTIYENN